MSTLTPPHHEKKATLSQRFRNAFRKSHSLEEEIPISDDKGSPRRTSHENPHHNQLSVVVAQPRRFSADARSPRRFSRSLSMKFSKTPPEQTTNATTPSGSSPISQTNLIGENTATPSPSSSGTSTVASNENNATSTKTSQTTSVDRSDSNSPTLSHSPLPPTEKDSAAQFRSKEPGVNKILARCVHVEDDNPERKLLTTAYFNVVITDSLGVDLADQEGRPFVHGDCDPLLSFLSEHLPEDQPIFFSEPPLEHLPRNPPVTTTIRNQPQKRRAFLFNDTLIICRKEVLNRDESAPTGSQAANPTAANNFQYQVTFEARLTHYKIYPLQNTTRFGLFAIRLSPCSPFEPIPGWKRKKYKKKKKTQSKFTLKRKKSNTSTETEIPDLTDEIPNAAPVSGPSIILIAPNMSKKLEWSSNIEEASRAARMTYLEAFEKIGVDTRELYNSWRKDQQKPIDMSSSSDDDDDPSKPSTPRTMSHVSLEYILQLIIPKPNELQLQIWDLGQFVKDFLLTLPEYSTFEQILDFFKKRVEQDNTSPGILVVRIFDFLRKWLKLYPDDFFQDNFHLENLIIELIQNTLSTHKPEISKTFLKGLEVAKRIWVKEYEDSQKQLKNVETSLSVDTEVISSPKPNRNPNLLSSGKLPITISPSLSSPIRTKDLIKDTPPPPPSGTPPVHAIISPNKGNQGDDTLPTMKSYQSDSNSPPPPPPSGSPPPSSKISGSNYGLPPHPPTFSNSISSDPPISPPLSPILLSPRGDLSPPPFSENKYSSRNQSRSSVGHLGSLSPGSPKAKKRVKKKLGSKNKMAESTMFLASAGVNTASVATPGQVFSRPHYVRSLFQMTKRLTVSDFAQALTHVEFEIYLQIRGREFIQSRWQKKPHLAKNLVELTNRFNAEIWWGTTQILLLKDLEQRVEMILHFIKVAEQLKAMNNFNGVMWMVSMFETLELDRLSYTWYKIKNQHPDAFALLGDLKAFVSEDGGSKKLRQAFVDIRPDVGIRSGLKVFRNDSNSKQNNGSLTDRSRPKSSTFPHPSNDDISLFSRLSGTEEMPKCLPFVGMFLTDILRYEAAYGPAKLESGEVNWKRCRNCAALIEDILKPQDNHYKFSHLNPVLVQKLTDLDYYGESQRYEHSLRCEPRGLNKVFLSLSPHLEEFTLEKLEARLKNLKKILVCFEYPMFEAFFTNFFKISSKNKKMGGRNRSHSSIVGFKTALSGSGHKLQPRILMLCGREIVILVPGDRRHEFVIDTILPLKQIKTNYCRTVDLPDKFPEKLKDEKYFPEFGTAKERAQRKTDILELSKQLGKLKVFQQVVKQRKNSKKKNSAEKTGIMSGTASTSLKNLSEMNSMKNPGKTSQSGSNLKNLITRSGSSDSDSIVAPEELPEIHSFVINTKACVRGFVTTNQKHIIEFRREVESTDSSVMLPNFVRRILRF